METTALRELLAARLGLDADNLGPSFLQSVARRCLHQSGHSDLRTFVRAAAHGGDAWHRLLELAVISETWFFRDAAPFDHIVGAVRALWGEAGAAPVRVLSCPCSTGEEAYSVAIALIDAGLPPDAFAINAADANPNSLRTAQAGVFKQRSFRGAARVDRARYFEYDHEGRYWQLKPAFQKTVKFHLANLVTLQGFEDARPYDIVLCRNLLIYLHAQARAEVMKALWRMMTEDGVLIVGHAEPAIAREHGFIGVGEPGAFAFVRSAVSKARREAPADAPRGRAQRDKVAPREGSRGTARNGPPTVVAPAAAWRSRPVAPTLERIRQLGDEGRMEEAIQACREYVRRVPDSADGYFLLGVFSGAMGHADAAESALRRALYLEPDHPAALTHLSLTRDAKGDTAGAVRLLSRANRSRKSSGRGER